MRNFRFTMAIAAHVLAGVVVAEDFSKSELKAAGPNCVHGYRVEMRTVAFYVGTANDLNREIKSLVDGKDVSVQYAIREVILHVGTKRIESPWDNEPRSEFANWTVTSFDDPEDSQKSTPRMHLRVDVWLGEKITLNELQIPKRFSVASGGEIEAYLRTRKMHSK